MFEEKRKKLNKGHRQFTLLALGFITCEQNGTYRLTEAGAAEAHKMDQGIAKLAVRVNRFVSSGETASLFPVILTFKTKSFFRF